MTNTAVYPGTFDPVTFGHIDVIRRVASIYDKVLVAVAKSEEKLPLFSVEDRVGMLKEAVSDLGNVQVEGFEGLAVAYARSKSSRVVVRGLRMISDFEYEFQMALTNRKLDPEIETVFMMPNEDFSYLTSRLIKEVACLGADVSAFVPRNVVTKLKEAMKK